LETRFVYSATTHSIRVTVTPNFLDDESSVERARYVWSYTIEIANLGGGPVQLLSRHWEITDSNGVRQEVDGPGVVGEQPHIEPGDAFTYTSGAPLSTPSGLMVGSYVMRDAEGERFEVDIPAFPLESPHERRVMH
jgi:ApaG protein